MEIRIKSRYLHTFSEKLKMVRTIQHLISILIIAIHLCSCATSQKAMPTEYRAVKISHELKGRLETVICKSSQPKLSERRMFVYLPENYYSSGESYPVMYLLHGARGTETSWIEKGHILQNVDSLTAAGRVRPMIVVIPNTNQYADDIDFRKSRPKPLGESVMEVNGTVEKLFVNDVVKTVDSLYRTIPAKDGRAIAGLSIGALQSIYISANNPDMFDYVGLFSPMIKPVKRHCHDIGFYRGLKKKQAVQFVDPPKLYWVMTGYWDIFCNSTQLFEKHLRTNGYSHRYYLSGGGHSWKNWENYCNMFMEQLWK